MKIGFIAIVGTASLVASADAGFLGFVAFAKQSGANVMVDVFAAVQNSGDKFLNVYNLNSSGTYVQGTGLTAKTWKPDAAGFTATRSSVDSFMTAGCYSGAAYGGEYYASAKPPIDFNTDDPPCYADFAYVSFGVGMAFQIVDDVLDVEGASGDLGKTAGKDAAAGKPTYPSIYGLDESRRMARQCIERAAAALAAVPLADGRLFDIGRWIIERDR